jgi:hypothetical protein
MAAAAPLAFAAALWMTNPGPSREIAALASTSVSDVTGLMAAVQTAGLRGTADIQGAVEEVRRIDGERVIIRGWAVDAKSHLPLTVIAFAGKAYVLETANDASNSISRLVGLSDPAPTNTPFSGTFSCKRGERIYIVAVTGDGRYSQFRSLACP